MAHRKREITVTFTATLDADTYADNELFGGMLAALGSDTFAELLRVCFGSKRRPQTLVHRDEHERAT